MIRNNTHGNPSQGDYRNVVNLGLVSFFTDISTEMVLSIFPFFLIKQLGATRALLGVTEGLGEAFSYIVRMPSGVLSDKLGKRKIIILAGYTLSTISKPFFAFTRVWTDALAVRSLDRSGKGLRTAPRDALLSDSIPPHATGRAFGIHRTLDQAGAIVGPLLAFALLSITSSRTIFLLSFIPGFVALIILVGFVREVSTGPSELGVLMNLRQVLQGRFLLLLTSVGIFSIGAYNFAFVMIKANELGVQETLLPVVLLVINAVHTSAGIPFGSLADKIGKEKTLLLGYLAFLLTSLGGVAIAGNQAFAYVLAALFGLYMGVTETVQRALIPDYVASPLRATAYGVYYLLIGACFLVANSVFGFLWDVAGPNLAFTYSVVTSILAILAVGLILSKK